MGKSIESLTELKSSQRKTHVSLDRDDSLQCAYAAIRAALDKKAENLKLLDLASCGGFTDFFVVCSGTSDRHVQTITDAVEKALSQTSWEILSIEGKLDGRWIVIDCAGVIVHVFLDALREYYDLETLWSDAKRCPIPSEFYGDAGTRYDN